MYFIVTYLFVVLIILYYIINKRAHTHTHTHTSSTLHDIVQFLTRYLFT